MTFLELHQVSKSYGEGATEVHALSGIDLSVDRDQTLSSSAESPLETTPGR